MTTIINGTEHEIHLFNAEQATETQGGRKLILNPGEEPVFTIAPGTNLNCVRVNKKAPQLDVPFTLKGGIQFVSHDPIPEGDIVIVSQLFKAAVVALGGDTSRLACIDGAVFRDLKDTRPCGCVALSVG